MLPVKDWWMAGVALLVAVLMALVAQMLFPGPASPAAPALCMDDETRELARGVMLEGITIGLRAHTTRLYDVWLKEPGTEPDRAAVGVRNGVSAFVRARHDIQDWAPPACKGDRP